MLLGYGVIIFLMMLGNGYMLYELYEISSTTKGTLSSDVNAIDLAKKLHTLLNDQELYARKYLISHDRTYIGLLKESAKQFDEHVAMLLQVHPERNDDDMIGRMEEQHEQFIGSITKEGQRRIPAVWKQNDNLVRTISNNLESIRATLDSRIQMSQLAIAASMVKAETITSSSSRLAFILIGGSLIAAILLALIIARTITQPIGVLIRGTERIARGSFERITVESRDEISSLATAINEMSTKLGQLNEAKAELTHQILHELQTPLTAILGALHIVRAERSGKLTDEQRQMVAIIEENSNKMRDFSHELLDIAKMEAGMITYDFVQTDIRPCVDMIVRSAKTGATRKNITINTRIDTTLPEITIDIQKISVVLNNLLSNAIKYTPANGRIDLEATVCDDKVKIFVRDNGIGIPEEDLPRLFTKFYRASNASLSGSKGTGIGLALVKAFTEGHGGIVSVTSTAGKGSTFTVELPASNGHSTIHTNTN
jgi:two-component system sensor histidine kinase GlrK